jgi:hypothetical protein
MLQEHLTVSRYIICIHSLTDMKVASPQVAALAAYWKALAAVNNRPNLSPGEIKQLITVKYARPLNEAPRFIKPEPAAPGSPPKYAPVPPGFMPMIWNGIDIFCDSWPVSRWVFGNFSDRSVGQDSDDFPACGLPGEFIGNGPTLTFSAGPTPSPTCLGNGCGKFCDASSPFCGKPGDPPLFNPDFLDPLNPQSPQNPSNPNFTPPGSLPPPTSTVPQPTLTPPPDPSGTPGPAKPKPSYNGHPLRETIIQITTPDSPNDIFLSSLFTEDDKLIQPGLCDNLADNIEQLSQKGLPSSVPNIKIQDDTCAFSATADWNVIKIGERVGTLTCKKWADARCIKDNRSMHCDNAMLPKGVDRQVLAGCDWVL